MAKCPCMQAIWEIDNALEEEIQLEEGLKAASHLSHRYFS